MNQHIETLQCLQNRAIALLLEFSPRAISAMVILTIGFLGLRESVWVNGS